MANEIINGRYEILKLIGKGGTSKVYLALDINLNKTWAVKEIRKDAILKNGEIVQNMIFIEIDLMKRLDHPNLPRIVDIIEESEKYYIVMDYIEGETLKKVLIDNGPQPQERVIKWGIEIASVLTYLHSLDPPVIYRDMKPANIILQPDGRLKLIDFGVARTYKCGKSEDTVPLGTKGYAAPEQFSTNKNIGGQSDQRTDIYNLGVTLYELLTNHLPTEPPYELYPLKEVNPKLSSGLDKIIHKCTRPNPDDRYKSADELIEDLLNYKKLDEEYIKKQKEKLRKVRIPFTIGIILMISGIMLGAVNLIMSANEYDALIVETGDRESRIENLERAISLKPKELQGYELMMEEYTKDGVISTSESENLLNVYNTYVLNQRKTSKNFLDINYVYGENYLTFFEGNTDTSLRNKVVIAMPFFEAIKDSGENEYDKYDIARACVDLGNFYRKYILEGNDILESEADRNTYKNLISDCNKFLDADFTGNNIFKITVYDLIINIMEKERINLTTNFDKDKIFKVIERIEKQTKNIKTSNAEIYEEKENILEKCSDVKSKFNDTYVNNSKAENGEE